MHWKKVPDLPGAVPGKCRDNPKGNVLAWCNLSLLQLGVVLIYPLLWCLCWARVPLASPGDQNMLPLPADREDVGHGAPCRLILGSQGKPLELPTAPTQTWALPSALPMHTRTGQRGICSTLLLQPLRFYSFTVSPRTKQSLSIVQRWGMQRSKARSAQPHRLRCDKPAQPLPCREAPIQPQLGFWVTVFRLGERNSLTCVHSPGKSWALLLL